MLVSGKTAELKRKDALPSYIFTALLIGAVFAANAAFPDLKTTGKLMKAAVLQPDINQDVEWTSKYKDETLNVFKEMMLQARAQSPDVYIWPETGYPGIFNADPFGPAEVASWAGPKAYNIVGSDSANYRNGEMNYYNSVFVLTPGAAISGMYSKMHLVPFGEYVPFSDTLKFVHKVVKRYGFVGFESGKKIEPLILNGVSAAPLVCYDGLFPEIGREFALKGADFFTHLSYESWYGRTPASAQIFTNTALRSVENDLYLARSVASGISGIVSNTGRITANTGLFKKEVLVGDIYVKPGKAKTPYTKYGDWFVLLCAALVVLMCIRGIKK
jgi:apolipoprotein N-acyltransferase